MPASKIMELVSGYDRSKNPVTTKYRLITFEEAKLLRNCQRVEFIGNDGKVRTAKINGVPQTWKTRPNNLRIPCKYDLYEFFNVHYTNGENFGTELVIPVS